MDHHPVKMRREIIFFEVSLIERGGKHERTYKSQGDSVGYRTLSDHPRRSSL